MSIESVRRETSGVSPVVCLVCLSSLPATGRKFCVDDCTIEQESRAGDVCAVPYGRVGLTVPRPERTWSETGATTVRRMHVTIPF